MISDDGENQDFLAATMEVNQAIREKNIRHAFRHFDQSGAGEITMADLVRVMGSEQHAREVVGECTCSDMRRQLLGFRMFNKLTVLLACFVVLHLTISQWTSTVMETSATRSSRP